MKEDEILILKNTTQEELSKYKEQYEKDLHDFQLKYEQERTSNNEKVKDLMNSHKREERLLTTAIYELGLKITELHTENQKLKTTKNGLRPLKVNTSHII